MAGKQGSPNPVYAVAKLAYKNHDFFNALLGDDPESAIRGVNNQLELDEEQIRKVGARIKAGVAQIRREGIEALWGVIAPGGGTEDWPREDWPSLRAGEDWPTLRRSSR